MSSVKVSSNAHKSRTSVTITFNNIIVKKKQQKFGGKDFFSVVNKNDSVAFISYIEQEQKNVTVCLKRQSGAGLYCRTSFSHKFIFKK